MNTSRRSLTLLLLSLVVMTMSMCVLLVGCSTSSTGPEVVLPDFRVRLTPDDVIYNFVLAYNRMDLDEYLDCLSEDFVFYPNEDDVTNDPTIPVFWYKDTEEDVHTHMFGQEGDIPVDSVSLTLMTTDVDTMPGADPGDPSDDVIVYTVDVDLRVNLFGGLTLLATAPSEFRFRVDTDQVGPGGQDLWEMFEWYDILEDARGELSEESSWGGIKALYR